MKSTGKIILFCLALSFAAVVYPVVGRTVKLMYDDRSPQILFAVQEIRDALRKAGHTVAVGEASYYIEMTIDPEWLNPQDYNIRMGQSNRLRITGGDPVGAMYGGLDLAESIRLHADLDHMPEKEGRPFIKQRGLKFNIPLDARSPSYDDTGDAAQRNILEMWSFDFWHEFLDDMARYRYNVLSLWSAHPYPSLIKLEKYPDIALEDVSVLNVPLDYQTDRHWNEIDIMDPENLRIVKKMTIEEKIDFWQHVMQYAADRGIDIFFFHWNIHMHGALGQYGIDQRQDNPNTIAYLRASVKELLLTYPLIKGIGVTAGERVNRELKGEYSIENWMWKTYGSGIMDAKAEQPDLQVRFIFRRHWSDLTDIRQAFSGYTDVFETSMKYSRARIYTTTSPPFFDQWYREDLEKNHLKCWLNLRNDDVFVHRWGNPDHVRKFLTNLPHDLLAGFYMGPDGYVWGREFISRTPQQPRQLEIRKHWFRFMLWGRLAYNPTLDRAFFEQTLAGKFPETDPALLYDAWASASQIIPQINRFHWFQNDLEWMAEACFDMRNGFHDVNRFIEYQKNHTGFLMDHVGSLTITQYVEAIVNEQVPPGVTPRQVADNLDILAERAQNGVRELRRRSMQSGEYGETVTDIESIAHLGWYYADKIRGAVELALFRQTGDTAHQERAVEQLRQAVSHWEAYAAASTSQYEPQLLARTRQLDWWQILEDVKQDVIIAREDRRP